ncbi:hypothetical protein GCM10007977_100580 [Dactylosporangium sucinum]|uniref:Uncharacterized protein n=1 Tax=Dactylosporangium sucinum TaxID=1424081 RepID=A0A917X748_9ACTN|nr:hypothetical protein GCM10007977_100580 [Dactylosporangium sucinum]
MAVLRGDDGHVRQVLFDGAPILPSAVFVESAAGVVLTGYDARRRALGNPQSFEPHPKRCVDDGTVLLDNTEIAVEALFAAVLRRVLASAIEMAGAAPKRVVLTHPVSWGPRRLQLLLDAAARAGMARTELVSEPVAAAAYFVANHRVDLPVGSAVLIYDLGAGTFDVTVVRRGADGFDVLASEGLTDTGGLDVDAAILAAINAEVYPQDPRWTRLYDPRTPGDLRASRALWDEVRGAKEELSRHGATFVHVPIFEAEVPLGREQFEAVARPILARTVRATRALLRRAGLDNGTPAAVLLVGGSSRIPLAATMLHQMLGVTPTLTEQPELAVAAGSLVVAAKATAAAPVQADTPTGTKTRGAGPSTAEPGPLPAPASPAPPPAAAPPAPVTGPPVSLPPSAPPVSPPFSASPVSPPPSASWAPPPVTGPPAPPPVTASWAPPPVAAPWSPPPVAAPPGPPATPVPRPPAPQQTPGGPPPTGSRARTRLLTHLARRRRPLALAAGLVILAVAAVALPGAWADDRQLSGTAMGLQPTATATSSPTPSRSPSRSPSPSPPTQDITIQLHRSGKHPVCALQVDGDGVVSIGVAFTPAYQPGPKRVVVDVVASPGERVQLIFPDTGMAKFTFNDEPGISYYTLDVPKERVNAYLGQVVWISITADPRNETPETNENNNQVAMRLNVPRSLPEENSADGTCAVG